MKNRLALCVLVKNDEYWLPYALQSVAGVFSRAVIYDVGSVDKTRDIIEWWVAKEKHRTDIFTRFLPDCHPAVQGAFRNSMIAEAQSDIYFLLDGDEVYPADHAARFQQTAEDLHILHKQQERTRYGLVSRIEINAELTQKYSVEREHHRFYTNDTYWTGTHPGERAGHKQNHKSEVDYRHSIACYHFHNTLRSMAEKDTHGRVVRKAQRSYHPGTLHDFDLLKEMPILQNQIEDWPVAPALKRLWDQ